MSHTYSTNINNIMEEIIKNNLFQFIISEHNLAEDKGAYTKKIIELYSQIINTNEFKTFYDKFDFFKSDNKPLASKTDNLNDYINFISSGNRYFTKPEFDPSPDTTFSIYENEIINCGSKKSFFIPLSVNSYDIDQKNGGSHCISIVINIITPNSTYEVYFLNSGGSTEYHSSKIDYTKKVDSIIKKTVGKELLRHFLYFVVNSKNNLELYHSGLSMLEQKSIYTNSGIESIELTNELISQDSFYEAQTVGSCTFRSIILSTITYMRFINGQIINDWNAFYLMLKLFIIESFYGFVNTEFLNDFDLTYKTYNLLIFYISDIYKELKLKIQTDNTDLLDIVQNINDKENALIKKIKNALDNSVNAKNNNLKTKLSTNIGEKTIINDLLEKKSLNINLAKPFLIEKFLDDFTKLDYDISSNTFFSNQSSNGIYHGDFINYYKELFIDLCNEAYENDIDIINPYILRFFIGINEYFKHFFDKRLEGADLKNNYIVRACYNKDIPGLSIYTKFNELFIKQIENDLLSENLLNHNNLMNAIFDVKTESLKKNRK